MTASDPNTHSSACSRATATAAWNAQAKVLLDYVPLALVFLFWSLPIQYSFPVAIGLLYAYYELVACQVPRVTTGNATMAQFLTRLPALRQAYRPSPFYFEGRLQTVLGLRKRLPADDKVKYDRREILHMADGGILGIDYLSCSADENGNKVSRPTVLLLPGLTSSCQTSYVKSLVREIHSAGYNVIVYNTRGLGGVPLMTPRWACGADCEDLHAAVVHIRRNVMPPGERLFVIGASFGGMLLSQLLLTYPDDCDALFSGALAISTIFDMQALLDSLEKPYFNKYVLNQGVTLDILGRAKKFPDVMRSRPQLWDFDHACKARTLKELDERLTCPMFGYTVPAEYYRRATTVHRLHEIRIPFFVLNAEDDPMQPGYSLPLQETAANTRTNVAFITTARGGHLGFLEGSGMKTGHFMERVVGQLLDEFHKSELGNADLAKVKRNTFNANVIL